jgi:Sulfotransferase family
MRISTSRRVLFVHIEKTGGKTVDAMFDSEVPDSSKGRPWARHWGYTRILAEVPEWADWWSFGFVRNPWDRMVSWWSMVVDMRDKLEAGDPEATKLYEVNRKGWDPILQYANDFDAFVLRGTDEVPRLSRPQIAKLTDRNSGRQVDFIGRQENFMVDLNVVREKLGLAPAEDVGRRNSSKHLHYSTYYTPETRRRVATVFKRDIRVFGYEFEG